MTGPREPADLWTPALGSLGVTVPIGDLRLDQIDDAYDQLEDLNG